MMHKDDITRFVNLSTHHIIKMEDVDKIRGIVSEESKDEKVRLQALFQREYILPGTLFIGYITEIVPLTDYEKELLYLAINNISGLGGAIVRGFGAFKLVYSDFKCNKECPSLRNFIEKNIDKILEILKSDPEKWLSEIIYENK